MSTITAKVRNLFRSFGPGIMTVAIVLGPGTITVCSKAGSSNGYSLLWVILLSMIFMVIFTRMAARIGCVSPKSLMANAEEQYGRTVAVLMGLSVGFSCMGFQAGNTMGVGLSMQALFGGGIALWAAVFLGITLLFIWTSNNFYSLLEKVMVVFVLVMVFAFAGNLFFADVNSVDLLAGFIPTPPSDLNLLVAMGATSFTVAGAAAQAYMVQGKKWKLADLKNGLRDATMGVILLGAMSAVIMITSAAVLYPKGIQVSSAIDMAVQLEPLLGPIAKWLFLIGLFSASFSSYVTNAVLSGIFLAEAFHLGKNINDKWVKFLASCVITLGTLIPVLFSGNPIQIIIFAQSITIFGAPITAVVLFMLSNNRKVMGAHRTKPVMNVMIVIAILWVLFLYGRQLLNIVG